MFSIATFWSASPAAQTPDTAVLLGTVADPSYPAITSAHITVTNETTGLTRAVDSDSAGPSRSRAYTVSITKDGFAAVQTSHVQHAPGSKAMVALNLKNIKNVATYQ
jgi:hypothetical protein